MKRGRPVGGSVQISKAQVESLPDQGTTHSIAKHLGVSATTVRNWCLMEDLPYTLDRSTYVITRVALLRWLVETKRVQVES
jgi:hypothetical protein